MITLRTTIRQDADGLHVEAHAPEGVADRTYVAGWGLSPKHGALAKRLARAIEAGVVLTNLHIATDVNDKTYVSGVSQVLARMLNADLRRLGF